MNTMIAIVITVVACFFLETFLFILFIFSVNFYFSIKCPKSCSRTNECPNYYFDKVKDFILPDTVDLGESK